MNSLFRKVSAGTAFMAAAVFGSASVGHAANVVNPNDGHTYQIYLNAFEDYGFHFGSGTVTIPNVNGDWWETTWSWPSGVPGKYIVAYPNAKLQVNPYSNGSDHGIAIWNLADVKSYWSYGVWPTSGNYRNSYDVAYDAYIAGPTYTPGSSKPGFRSRTEVMIWLNYANTGPIGNYFTTYTDRDNRVWKVAYGINGLAATDCDVYSFVPQSGSVNNATFHLQDFCRWIVYSLPYNGDYQRTPTPIPTDGGRLTEIGNGVEIHTGVGKMTTWAATNWISTYQDPNN